MSQLEKGLDQLGISYRETLLEQLNLYMDELEFWNRKYGLVKMENREELVVRHILDSLAGLPLILNSGALEIADLGSGAGLPGLVLALFMPSAQFHLVERSGRRCRFLESTVMQLKLDNVEIYNGDLKEVDRQYDLVTFRAFRPFEEEILKGILRILKPSGILAAYKGKLDKTRQEEQALLPFFQESQIIPMKVPFLKGQRNMLWLKK